MNISIFLVTKYNPDIGIFGMDVCASINRGPATGFQKGETPVKSARITKLQKMSRLNSSRLNSELKSIEN